MEIFNACNEVTSIRDKDEFLIPFITTLTDPAFTTACDFCQSAVFLCLHSVGAAA